MSERDGSERQRKTEKDRDRDRERERGKTVRKTDRKRERERSIYLISYVLSRTANNRNSTKTLQE